MITILTTGSRGDTQPYLALGVRLQQAGYIVRIAAFENYADLVASYGLPFYPIRGDVSRVATSQIASGAMKADNPLKVLLSFNTIKSFVFDLQADFYAACQGAQAVVYHPGAPVGYFYAQQHNIPAVLASPFPMTPTRAYPSLIFYHLPRLGGAFNHLSHKILEQMLWTASSAAVRRFWRAQFGQDPPGFGCPFSRHTSQDQPAVISCSQHVFPRPPDWSEHVHAAGYWFLESAPGWQPPADLAAFLRAGKPPVYVGFGSMGDTARSAETAQLVCTALRRAGQRGVVAAGWAGMRAGNTPGGDLFFIDSAPHDWLFPQMSAVVHHGGAGTTAAGLRAGVPTVIVPFANDQFAWARRVHELGVGAPPLPRRRLNAENLAAAIQNALSAPLQTAARQLGEKIRAEDGAGAAAGIISGCLRG